MLHDAGASVHTRALDGSSPLLAATVGGYPELVAALVSMAEDSAPEDEAEEPCGAQAVDYAGYSALMSAALCPSGECFCTAPPLSVLFLMMDHVLLCR